MSLADLPAIQKLTRAEQLELVADLWDHIAAHPGDDLLPLSLEEETLLDGRLAAHQAAPDAALSLEEFKRQFAVRL